MVCLPGNGRGHVSRDHHLVVPCPRHEVRFANCVELKLEILFLLYTFQDVLDREVRISSSLEKVRTCDSIPGEATSSPNQNEASSSATSLVDDTPNVSQCLVRPSTSADIPYITAIYARFVSTSTATFEIVAPSESEMLRRRQAVLDRDLPYLVAELEGYIVGFCYASQFRPREGYRYTVEDSIYVRPDCIGHGVGKRLLAELISECQAKGCHSMVACICGVNVSSVSLHASLGFQQVGLLSEAGNKFGEWLRLLIMQRPLQ
jgi:L-amino acid N-acyltransferase YncA